MLLSIPRFNVIKARWQWQVKMVTADDDSVTDIVIEGDEEEAERFRKELDLAEKGKVYVKGLLEP